MGITTEAFGRLFADIWTTAVGLPSTDVPAAAGEVAGTVMHTGQVQLTGGWSGAVLIELSDALAGTAAGQMFGLTPDELSPDDVADAVGELANMLGGNVKAHLGASCDLSLPSVTVGDGYRVSVSRSKVVCELRRRCGGETVVVRLLEGTTG
jgi:chemotaxis protein CheX